MTRYACIHGHFYQPPRENPWLEMIELQDSAYPFHDWNERITAECYAPNSVARVLDASGRIATPCQQLFTHQFQFRANLAPLDRARTRPRSTSACSTPTAKARATSPVTARRWHKSIIIL